MIRRNLALSAGGILLIAIFIVAKPLVDTPDWMNWLGPLSLAALVTFSMMPPLQWYARRKGLLDEPDERKKHKGSVPLVGGIAIFVGFIATNLIYRYHQESSEVLAIMIALVPLIVLGVIDDRKNLPASMKLLIQLTAVVIVICGGVRFTFMPQIWWGDLIEILFTTIWLIGLTNAINFLDGIDGLATSLVFIATMAFGVVAVQTAQPFFLLLCSALGGACLGFLPFNFRRTQASAFLGDAGATLLGFSIASIAIVGEWGGTGATTLDLIVPLLILGVPIFDTTFITVTRFADGRIRTFRQWIEYTGRDHIHHRLMDLGLSRHDTVGFLCVICIVLALSAITLKNATGFLAILSLLQGVIILTIVGRFMLFMAINKDIESGNFNGSTE